MCDMIRRHASVQPLREDSSEQNFKEFFHYHLAVVREYGVYRVSREMNNLLAKYVHSSTEKGICPLHETSRGKRFAFAP
jgi:hypothetical protein